MNKYISKNRLIYFLSALVIIIGCYALNLSYSMFVQTEEANLVDTNIPVLNVSLDKSEILISPNKTEIYNIMVKNQSEFPINFAVNATSSSTNYLIQVVDINDNLSYGTMDANTNKNVVLAITNNNESEISINFTVDSNYSTISYDFNSYLANTIIDNTNKYNNNFKAQVINKDLVTSGDGLYNVEGDFIYKGLTLNNYIKFSTDTSKVFRIVSFNSDNTIKLVENGLNRNIAFDASTNRTYNIENSLVNSSYCTNADLTPDGELSDVKYGCNSFKSYDTLTTDYSSGNVANDSTIKQFLDNDYLGSLSETLRLKLLEHVFYNGFLDTDDKVSEINNKINLLSFNSNIGLLSVKDIIDSDLTVTPSSNVKETILSNYLVAMSSNNSKIWLLNGTSNNSWEVWNIAFGNTLDVSRASRETELDDNSVTMYYYAKPVIFIDDNVVTTGTGTSEDPYIVNLS